MQVLMFSLIVVALSLALPACLALEQQQVPDIRSSSRSAQRHLVAARALRQSDAAASESVTVVTTAEQLIAAVGRGDAHIELQAHLDLTAPSVSSSAVILGDIIPSSVQSITVCFQRYVCLR